uniref:PEThy;ZPT2-6 n=1 Tax=Petunia hybrida TaxID=4102 RepID=P93714_PETHY|nr:PEThy;ZPT2-6 [Petunia x hybrida]
MEALEEVVGVPNKDHFHIVKGKRTKRLRLQSPIPFTVAATHDSSNACDYHKNDTDNGEDVPHNNNNNNSDNNASPSSAPSAEMFINTFTEDEEETARYLILMSKCDDHLHPRNKSRDGLPPDKFELFNDDLKLYQSKFNSKRYIETSTNLGNGTKAGIFVYECKTCNRTFPSFQALGGHRASHKKPKTLTTELVNNKKLYFDFSDEDDQPSPSTTLCKTNKDVNRILPNSSNKYTSPRIHECSYCGAEFTSGQALGGHMRRHRGGVNVNSSLHLSNYVSPATSIDQEFANNTMKKVPRDGLSLDLNLPVSDDNLDPKYPVVSLKQQDQEKTQRQQLVDCHY